MAGKFSWFFFFSLPLSFQGDFQTAQILTGLSGADTWKNSRNAAAAAALSAAGPSVLAQGDVAAVLLGCEHPVHAGC